MKYAEKPIVLARSYEQGKTFIDRLSVNPSKVRIVTQPERLAGLRGFPFVVLRDVKMDLLNEARKLQGWAIDFDEFILLSRPEPETNGELYEKAVQAWFNAFVGAGLAVWGCFSTPVDHVLVMIGVVNLLWALYLSR